LDAPQQFGGDNLQEDFMNFLRMGVLGAFVVSTGLMGLEACSSSSKNGGSPEPDAGKSTSSGSNTSSNSSNSSNTSNTSSNSSNTSNTSNSSSSSSSSTSRGPSCTVNPGTYTLTNTLADGGTASAECPPPTGGATVTYPMPPPDASTDASIPDTGLVCTVTTTGCTTSTTCMGTLEGMYNDMSSITYSVTNGVPSTSTSSALTYLDGAAVTPACSYNTTYTLGGSSPDAGMEQ